MITNIIIMLILIALAILIYISELDELKFEFQETLIHKQLRVKLENRHIASIILYSKKSDQKYLVDKNENIKAFLAMFDNINIRKALYTVEDGCNLTAMDYKFMILYQTEEVFPIMYNSKNKTLMVGEEFFQLKGCFEADISNWISSMYSDCTLEARRLES